MSDKRELRVVWSAREMDLMFHRVRGPDGSLAQTVLCSNPCHGPSLLNPNDPEALPFTAELERRGYDLTTLKFSIQLRDNHPWIKRDAILYRQDGGMPVKVDWIRWRGRDVRVFLATPDQRRKGEPAFEVPFFTYSDGGMDLAQVERRYQPTPAEPAEWSPDDLPPMFPTTEVPPR